MFYLVTLTSKIKPVVVSQIDTIYSSIDSLQLIKDTLIIKEKEIKHYYHTELINETNNVISADDSFQIQIRKMVLE